ncbi:MAG: FimV/HubP family polar landmark protein, partial [Pseudomonadales bacterium]
MTRKLMLLCATLVALAGKSAYGVGLGELELDSALNQKFKAEIELTNVGSLEADELMANLASSEDFDRVGVQRHYILTNLRFNIDTDDRGKPVIKVTSRDPIVEPYLNFIVEVLWPSGRILREYTVLLDPPVFGEGGVQPIRVGETERPSREQREDRPQRVRPEAVEDAPPERDRRMADEGELTEDEYGMTGPGDTLWAIALKVRPNDSVSVQQTMLALQRVNPDAFINGNINLLKAGHVLRIPDLAEIRAQGREQAISNVQRHNEEFQRWREQGGELAQLDATRRQQSTGSGATQDSGELRLMASERESGARSGAGGSSERQAELEADLAVAQEDLDRANRENQELGSRIADLESQIEDLNALVEAKDDQLASLQEQLRKQLAQAESGAESASRQPRGGSEASSLLTNPFVLGGLGLFLIGGLAGGMVYMRKRRESSALDEEEFREIAPGDDTTRIAADDDDQDSEVDVEEVDEELAPQTSDVISEAEIYIAYGRFPQAITFLQNAIEAEPERSDLHLKLLEVYVETEEATAFNLQFDKLKELGDEEAIARGAELQQKIPGAAETAESAMDDDATVVRGAAVNAPDEAADDSDDDLNFDLDDLDSETDEDDLDFGSDLEDDSAELDLDLDLDEQASSGETAQEPVASESESGTAAEDDELDLDLDSDEEIGSAQQDDDTEVNLDDAEFNLDDDAEWSLDDDETATADTAESASSGDEIELNLDDEEF